MLKINNISSFQAFQLFKYAGQLFISISLAKSGLLKAEIGQFEYFNFIASGFSFFWIIGIMQTLLSIYSENDSSEKNAIFFNTSIYLAVCSIFSVLLILVYLKFSEGLITSFQIYILLIYALINPVGLIIEYILLLKKQFKTLIVYGVIMFFTPLVLVATPLLFDLNIDYCMLGLLVWSVLKFTLLCLLISKHSIIKIDIFILKRLLKHSLPLMGTAFITGSAAYIDGYIISQNYDTDTFAMFRYGAKEFPLFVIIASAFSSSIIPELSKIDNLQSALSTIRQNSKKMMLYSFPVAIFFLFTSKYLYTLVFSSDFEQSYEVFNIYLLLIISRFIFSNSILIGLKQNAVIFRISILALSVNIISSLTFLQFFGYLGVAYGTFVAYIFEKLSLVVILKRKTGIKASKYIVLRPLVLYSSLLIVCYILINSYLS